ncbi:COQ9 family protein [Lentibacter sp.]|jgi:ubiquinone biosynthesis protein COQ9|uniref:COQ9 family protein n=1 Tax=Lentibacter sp. TaxID=2024994 RepID=UPI003F6A086B
MADLKDRLLDAALDHVPFDGWSAASFEAAVADAGLEPALAHGLCPRGAVDLAVAYHKRGDARMLARLAQTDLGEMRYSARVTAAVRYRLEAVEDKELVRRGMTLFALPRFAPEGARLIWETCDAIWEALGDTSEDLNWYTKRATLSGVYSSAVLYWLGDTSEGHAATWAFLERRIEDVMKIEKVKHALGQNKLFGDILGRITDAVRAPEPLSDMPGAAKK